MRPAFDRLRAVTLDPASTLPDLTAALADCHAEVTARWRHTEGDVYAAAQRRYLLMTGTTCIDGDAYRRRRQARRRRR
jgi:hypothetical protein